MGEPSNPSFYCELISSDKDSVKLQLAIRVIRLLKDHVYTVQIKEVATSDTEIDRNTIQNTNTVHENENVVSRSSDRKSVV